MSIINWDRYPFLVSSSSAKTWLSLQLDFGLASNTINAYARALEDYLSFSNLCGIDILSANRQHVASYVREISARPNPRLSKRVPFASIAGSIPGLANATLQQRLTVLRLYYDYLIEEGLRSDNPVGRGRYTPGRSFGSQHDRGLLPRYRRLPWIPTSEQWQSVLEAARLEPVRNRAMLALAYDAALRREELCSLTIADIDPALRLLRIRAETTKNRQERIVPYSESTSLLYQAYLTHRHSLSRDRGPLFLSESHRNRSQPVSIWTWSKVIQGIAHRSAVHRLTTHTFRHLCLTDLAQAGWELHEIAKFAGHRSIQSTLSYIHLSGRDLSAKLNAGMSELHSWRVKQMAEVLK